MRIINTPNALICFSEFNDGDLSFYRFSNEKSNEIWQNLPVVIKNALPSPTWVNQIHSNIILTSDGKIKNKLGDADGIITNVPNNPIGVFTADCTPIILFGNNFVCAVHSGWKGCQKNIASEAVKELKNKYNVSPQNISAIIGPCINQCCLELGKEVYNDFVNTDIYYKQFFALLDKPHLDMRGLIRFQLIKSGIKDYSIMDIDLCTYCSENAFYSYRRQKQRNGSMFSFAMLKNTK